MIGSPRDEKPRALTCVFIRAALVLDPRTPSVPATAVDNFLRGRPRAWIVEGARECYVNAILVEVLVACTIDQHDVAFQIRIPMHCCTPVRIGRRVAIVPGLGRRHQYGSHRILPSDRFG